ncbi:DNA polymerase I [Dyadobacter sp. Leaf189]|uniref:DNA polymerase I n=1 Tax=Dyadobacter sp. Leaf189 TaxID=1736295 RepID=UPI0006FF2684|nr:DNA polymerase I [Dyadobacter sp. Leaf189]KQS28195.1 DNA polymerase I [Dyadobacter sp. Leaf189]
MDKPVHKLFLLDAMALIYRAHFAFIKAPRITSKGLNTSAVFGFTNTLLEVLQKEKPTHIGVAFDTAAPTFRHIQFEAYKAQRQEQPEDITVAIPLVKRLLKAMCIPILELDGYEADDIIGTIAKEASIAGFEVFMMTPDKDYGQLVEEHVHIYKPAFLGKSAEVLGVNEILERWQIQRIDQVIDILGLMGDAVDNIPGVPGVGEKTAQKLISEYDTIENLITHADEIKGKLGEKIRENFDKAVLSKQLATIDIKVPVPFDAEDLTVCPANADQIVELFDELEFKTLKQRVLGIGHPIQTTQVTRPVAKSQKGQLDLFGNPTEEVGKQPAILSEGIADDDAPAQAYEDLRIPTTRRTIDNTFHRYHTVDTPELMKSLAYYLNLQDAFCFDTETTSLETIHAELVGLSFSYLAGEAFYVPVPADRTQAQEIVEYFRGVFENENIEKIGQNVKYDLLILKNYGIEVKGKLSDTMLAHYILEPDKRHGMDILAASYLNYDPVSITSLIGKKGVKQGTMRDVAIPEITQYAGEDADITLQLNEIFSRELPKVNASKLYYEVEMPLTKVLASMESTGVRLDINALREMSAVLESDLRATESEIYEAAGQSFNISSPKQLGEVLFEKMKLIEKPKKTKTGQYATGEDILSDLENNHVIARKILDYRELQKLKSTYVDALPLLVSKKSGRIHTSYNQAVAATGRLSSTNPNLQNIPIRTPRGREIRKAFVPDTEEFQILSADYSQIELRIMAAFSQDSSMTEAFNQGRDIHSTTASKVFKVDLEDVTSDMRRKSKMVNFGIIYGISAFGLAQRLGIARGEASEIIRAYFEEFPAVKGYMDRVVNEAREKKYVETILGRRRYLPDIISGNQTNRGYAERNAINAPIQGSAADMIKVAMINIHDWMQKEQLKSRMILQVHDELVFDAHRDEISLLKEKVDDLMRNAIPMSVRMETGIGVGANWLEAH